MPFDPREFVWSVMRAILHALIVVCALRLALAILRQLIREAA
jgi:hypothetical protein